MKTNSLTHQPHQPVLLNEVIGALRVKENALLQHGNLYIDATLGFGGHTTEIIKNGGVVLGLDTDPEALKATEDYIRTVCESCKVVHGNFRNLKQIAAANGFSAVNGILLDLGVSSPQLTSENRGFSFRNPEAFLDMRLDQSTQAVTAADLLNALSKKQLINLFNEVLPYPAAKKIADQVIKQRTTKALKTVGDLLESIDKAGLKSKKQISQATLPFMALRMAVNSELSSLKEVLPQTLDLLVSSGRLAVISFHSGEDAIIKHQFAEWEKQKLGIQVNKEPIVPALQEIGNNPRARSAKLRIFEKI